MSNFPAAIKALSAEDKMLISKLSGELNPRQRAFCHNVIEMPQTGWTYAQCMENAGYSNTTAWPRMLDNKNVKAYLNVFVESSIEQTFLARDTIDQKLIELLDADIGDILKTRSHKVFDPDNPEDYREVFIPELKSSLEDMTPGARALITSMKMTSNGLEVRFTPKIDIVRLALHRVQSEPSDPTKKADLSPNEAARRISALLAKGSGNA